ncbi:hydroxyphenylacetyl-CoA thioesterase PaaI [Ornithinimicrobium sufpigmenti]|uniref:hydroxyphenylacetyl-CoA thioesterase PaaI n=1 Tax=Ornithinimicrobium sufpigmenti TaxID=2508882 RepID=UPI001EDD5FF3|nr:MULTISPECIES: hydroxyphenylacetyl-CoA thioesterase PaaI [unclassified Ornithinimicrobium]
MSGQGPVGEPEQAGLGRPDLPHVNAMWAADEASRALGIEVLQLEVDTAGATPVGRARTRMRVTAAMVNGHEIAHGGYIFTLADSTFALACNATGRLTVAAGADITYVAAGRLGDVLVATAVERVRYGRSGITDVTVTRASDGAVLAEFRGRSRSLPTPTEVTR